MEKGNFGKIGVLAGGPSSEREISLKSGTAVYNALIREGLDAVFLDVRDDVCDIIRDSKTDVAFLALHGRFGEDGTVQKMLEELGLPYTGSGVEASRLALDKIASRELFIKAGIPVPKYKVLEKGKFKFPEAERGLSFPIVVKPQLEGSSIGLSIARRSEELGEAFEKAFACGDRIILEEYIFGRELTVGVLEDEALPVIEIITSRKVYDYHAKYHDPSTQYLVPAPIDKSLCVKAEDLAVRSHRALGCEAYSRVDMMVDERTGAIAVLEVNTIPGMTERSLFPKAAAARGTDFGRLCIKLIELAIKKAKKGRAHV